MITVDIILGC